MTRQQLEEDEHDVDPDDPDDPDDEFRLYGGVREGGKSKLPEYLEFFRDSFHPNG